MMSFVILPLIFSFLCETISGNVSYLVTMVTLIRGEIFLLVKFLNSVNLLSTVVEISLSLFLLYFNFIAENKILSLEQVFPGGWGFARVI